jgi:hypothetical protein
MASEQAQKEPQMGDLRDFVIGAHGGLDRWNQLSEVRAHLLIGGVLWAVKKQDGVLNDSMVRVELHRPFASHDAFEKGGLRTSFTPDRAAIETTGGQVVAERSHPRAAFDGHVLDTPWDWLHLVYFCGYTQWNYLTTPFSFAQPGYLSEELEPWREDGQTWRRLKVTFPAHIATHCAEQVFYFDADGLLRRHDYIPDVVGWGPVAHYTSGHREFDGIMVPTRRRVYPVDPDGNVAEEPFLVTIDLDSITFS